MLQFSGVSTISDLGRGNFAVMSFGFILENYSLTVSDDVLTLYSESETEPLIFTSSHLQIADLSPVCKPQHILLLKMAAQGTHLPYQKVNERPQ